MDFSQLYLPEIPKYRNPDAKIDPFIRFAKPDIKILFPHVNFPEIKEFKQERKLKPMEPITPFLKYFDKEPNPSIQPTCDPQTKKKLLHEQKMAENAERLKPLIAEYKPKENPKATKECYKTLIVANLAYDIDDACLKRHFSRIGHVTQAVVIYDKEGKSRGYGFVEYESEKDFKRAYDRMNNEIIHDRHIVVDVERARTSPNWLPRRLGGGLGKTRSDMIPLHHNRAYKKRVLKNKLKREKNRERNRRRVDRYREDRYHEDRYRDDRRRRDRMPYRR